MTKSRITLLGLSIALILSLASCTAPARDETPLLQYRDYDDLARQAGLDPALLEEIRLRAKAREMYGINSGYDDDLLDALAETNLYLRENE